ncbi:MAG: hypothetical protein J6T87_07545 [Bacteroidales bacterium]|nr:hypothetical protein [Bacteroidales bacterium]
MSKIEDIIMGFTSRIKRDYHKRRMSKGLQKKITRNFKDLENRRSLTEAQKKEVNDFYISMIGKTVPLYCHEYFYSRTGVFSKDYVPKDFYTLELLQKANVYQMRSAYDDKNIYDIILAGENVVHTILKNMNGYYYFEGKPVSEEEAVQLCQNMEGVILKPAMDKHGNGVKLLTVTDGVTNVNGLTIGELFKQYKHNFLIQERVKQHKDIAALNPTSVNTMRILTYRSGMEVLVIYSVIRIGRSGQVIDNQCAGGISTTITKDGKLGRAAFGGYSEDNVLVTDTGVTLEGYQLPSYDKAIEFVKRLHTKLPYFNIVGWDVSIEEDGEPILIEFNTHPGLSQSAFCSGMGENTERIIRELWPRRNTMFEGYE